MTIDTKTWWAWTGKSVFVAIAMIITGIIFREGVPFLGDGWQLTRIVLVLALVATLIRKRWDVGISLLLAALAMGLLFSVDTAGLRDAMTFGMFNPQRQDLRRLALPALELAAMVFLINVLGGMLGARDSLKRLIFSLEHLVRDIRYVAAIIPAAIGLLPTPGGALITAPLVNEVGERVHMSAEVKTACNYWFRHVWEYWWPLYPGLIYILNDEELGVRASRFMLALLPLTFMALAGGWFFILRRISRPVAVERGDIGMLSQLKSVARTLWPVAAVVAALLMAPNRIQGRVFILALMVVNLSLAFQKRLSGSEIRAVVAKIRTGKLLGLIITVYILRGMFLVSEAAVGLPEVLMASRVPVALVCFFVPWIVSLLTGFTLAGIVTALPLLMGFIVPAGGGLRLDLLMLAYTGSFTGVLMSPSHLCLTLTLEYYAADFGRVFKLLLAPYIMVLVGVALLGFILAWIG